MRILVTNDDGIHAHGLGVLEGIARALSDDVWVVAPESDQSGVSHSLSLNDPLRLRQISEKHFAVKGTPTDCVIMGIRHILKDHMPDLVLSGVNHGQNVAEDVTYSGTIAAAMEGTILGVRSIALSQAYGPQGRDVIRWDCAAKHGADIIRKVLEIGFPKNTLVNINFPNCPPEDVMGTASAVQGQRNQELLRVDERADGRGKPYFWIAFSRGKITPAEGTDLHALAEKRISITPIKLDLTDLPTVTEFARVFGG
jgi:5'-nucleotidase